MEKQMISLLSEQIGNLERGLSEIERQAAQVKDLLSALRRELEVQKQSADEVLRMAAEAETKAASALERAEAAATAAASVVVAPQTAAQGDEPEIEVELIVDEPEEPANASLDERLAGSELLTDEEHEVEEALEDVLVSEIEKEPAVPVSEPISAEHAERPQGVTLPQVDDIRKAISIGDRFLFQRELFASDGELMNKTIDTLNKSRSLDEAIAYIEKKFRWDKESQAYELFLNVLRRRF